MTEIEYRINTILRSSWYTPLIWFEDIVDKSIKIVIKVPASLVIRSVREANKIRIQFFRQFSSIMIGSDNKIENDCNNVDNAS